MGFFDDIARSADDSAMRAFPRPDGQVPAPLAIRLMLGRSGQAAVAVVGLWAFTAGFEFLVSAQLRQAVPGTSAASFAAALDGDPLDGEFCRLGVQFSTGEKAANTQLRATREEGSPIAGPVMKVRTGGAGVLSRDWRYWVSPLPPPGPLAFVCEWPALGIPESRTGIDAALILDAANQSIALW